MGFEKHDMSSIADKYDRQHRWPGHSPKGHSHHVTFNGIRNRKPFLKNNPLPNMGRTFEKRRNIKSYQAHKPILQLYDISPRLSQVKRRCILQAVLLASHLHVFHLPRGPLQWYKQNTLHVTAAGPCRTFTGFSIELSHL